MESGSPDQQIKSATAAHRQTGPHSLPDSSPQLFSLLQLFLLIFLPAWAGQARDLHTRAAAPELLNPAARAPQNRPPPDPCQIKSDAAADAQAGAAGTPCLPIQAVRPSVRACNRSPARPLRPLIDWYARFLNGPQVKPLTPKQKAWLATRNVIDPFNGITILGNSAIYVGANAHSAYGPGMTGFGQQRRRQLSPRT